MPKGVMCIYLAVDAEGVARERAHPERKQVHAPQDVLPSRVLDQYSEPDSTGTHPPHPEREQGSRFRGYPVDESPRSVL